MRVHARTRRMRWVGLLSFTIAAGACYGGSALRVSSKTDASAVSGGVLAGQKTSLTLRGGVLTGDRMAALLCVEGTGTTLPPGEVLATLGPDGAVVERVSVEPRCTGRLVRAGADLVLVSSTGERDRAMQWWRFDAALRPLGHGEVPMPGPIIAVAGRDDGALLVASLADTYEPDPRIEVAIMGRDMTATANWALRGEVWLTNLVPDGTGVLAVGRTRGAATIDGSHPWSTVYESLLVVRLGTDRVWSRTIEASGVSVTSYEQANLVKAGSDVVVTWNTSSTGERRAAPDYERLGGMPGMGSRTFFARLDGTGAITRGYQEPADRQGGALSLTVLPGGELLEHRVREADAYELPGCRDPHGCHDSGGPEAYGHIDTLVIRRRDSATFAVIDEQTLGGSMIVGGSAVAPVADGIAVAGSFAGTLRLPGLTSTSPQSRESQCSLSWHSSASERGLFASQPPPDPCEVTVTRHAAVFVTRLTSD